MELVDFQTSCDQSDLKVQSIPDENIYLVHTFA